MPKVDYRIATDDDAISLAPRLRAADIIEIDQASGRTPENALRRSVEVTDVPVAVTLDGQVELIFGVHTTSLMSRAGAPWLLGSDEVDNHPRRFLRASKEFVDVWRKDYTLLHNYVYHGHERSILWLKWLGFTLHDPEPFGPWGSMFHKFTMRSDDV